MDYKDTLFGTLDGYLKDMIWDMVGRSMFQPVIDQIPAKLKRYIQCTEGFEHHYRYPDGRPFNPSYSATIEHKEVRAVSMGWKNGEQVRLRGCLIEELSMNRMDWLLRNPVLYLTLNPSHDSILTRMNLPVGLEIHVNRSMMIRGMPRFFRSLRNSWNPPL